MKNLFENIAPKSINDHAEQAYLNYAMSVVAGRAIPYLADGQKPVQRRILYVMKDMGLLNAIKHIKSAKIVGAVMGAYHPHGDSSIYEASVRMAQSFSLRYPLVDPQGTFGTRDGDSPAAMRYTEQKLQPIAETLLSELSYQAVDFVPNFDGTEQEPSVLPARLPFVLLNGASGIAVGMATEIPSHNMVEVGQACIALIKNPDLNLSGIMEYIKGPDFACGSQIISSPEEIKTIYETGRGSIRLRAKWHIEQMTRGQWQLVVDELPQNTSTYQIMMEIEELSNPKVKKDKKTLSQDQQVKKQLFLSNVDGVMDESDKQNPVRLVFTPKSSKISPEKMINFLLYHTSLETNYSLNMVVIDLDGNPKQLGLLPMLKQWLSFRYTTVKRRLNYQLNQINDRLHILDGRLLTYLKIEEVIAIIKDSEDPYTELQSKIGLSSIQANDVLELKLRQIANLEKTKIEKEYQTLSKEKMDIEKILSNSKELDKLIISELSSDVKKYGDERRTLIEQAAKVSLEQEDTVLREPISIFLSINGWIKCAKGHNLDIKAVTFKNNDPLLSMVETYSNNIIALLDNHGRIYNVAYKDLPSGRTEGIPVSTLIDIQDKGKIVQLLSADSNKKVLLGGVNGYGFYCSMAKLATKLRAGKAHLTLDKGELPLPVKYFDSPDQCKLLSIGGDAKKRCIIFPLEQMKELNNGGKGVMIQGLNDKEKILHWDIITNDTETIAVPFSSKSINANDFAAERARKGGKLD